MIFLDKSSSVAELKHHLLVFKRFFIACILLNPHFSIDFFRQYLEFSYNFIILNLLS